MSATFEEYQAYVEQVQSQLPEDGASLNMNELAQVAGGTKGFGATLCIKVGTGLGITDDGGCIVFGGGENPAVCAGEGTVWDD